MVGTLRFALPTALRIPRNTPHPFRVRVSTVSISTRFSRPGAMHQWTAFPPESGFCVPLVTITFKTWVFRDFAMERRSGFASFEMSESEHSRMNAEDGRGPMLRRAKLINPFEIAQERITQDRVPEDRPPPIDRKATSRGARSTPVCAACGSDDIICHATAQWSNEAQEWQLANTFNQPAHCNTCHHDGNLVWLTLN